MSPWHAKRFAEGFCPNCGVRPRGDRVQQCDFCRARHQKQVTARRARRIAQRICIECGAREIDGRRRCVVCKDARRIARNASRARARTTPDPREPPCRTGNGSETQDTPESSGLALETAAPLVGPIRKKQLKVGVRDDSPLAARSVSQYELRKMGAWRP